MRFYINHTSGGRTFSVDLTGDVRQDAARISTLFPGEIVIVWALSRGRLHAKDGVVTDTRALDGYYDLDHLPPKLCDQIRHEWDALINATPDPLLPDKPGDPVPKPDDVVAKGAIEQLVGTLDAWYANEGYDPLAVVTWQRALEYLAQHRARYAPDLKWPDSLLTVAGVLRIPLR